MGKRRRQRRVRYGMGPGGVVYVVVTALILAASLYTQANLLFWAFGLMIGGLVVSALYTWRALRGVSVQRLLPSHGVAGEMLVVRYHITSKSWLPQFGLMVHETWGRGPSGWKRVGPVAERPALLGAPPRGWVLHLGPNQACQAEAPCWPLRRGPIEFEQVVVSTSFPFNVFNKSVAWRQSQQALVYPHLHRINRRLLARMAHLDVTGRHQTDRTGGHEEFYGLREYRPGDSLKMIDWRRSARTGKLVAREMTKPTPPRMMILLDLSDPGPPAAHTAEATGGRKRGRRRRGGEAVEMTEHELQEERAISLAASLVCDGYLHGYQVGLAIKGPPAQVYPPHHSLPHRARLFEALARVLPARRDQRPEAPAVDPNVVVTAGEGDGGAARRGVVRLGARRLEDYILDSDAGALLSARVLPVSRREQVARQQAERSQRLAGAGRGEG